MEAKRKPSQKPQADPKTTEESYSVRLEQFNQATTVKALQKALNAIPRIDDPDPVEKAKELFLSKQKNIAVRILALQKIQTAILNDAPFIRSCLAVLADPTESVSVRNSVLEELGTLDFASRTFKAMRFEYINVLRRLLDDSNAVLRKAAAGVLANYKDEVAISRLLSGLKGEQELIVPRATAIQLVARDPHTDYYPVVREILQDPGANNTEKIEAVHALAFDQVSKPLLTKFFLDKKENTKVRMSSVSALQAAHPTEFAELAKPVIIDEKEKKDVRTASLNALMHGPNARVAFGDETFLNEVSNLKTLKRTKDLKNLSGQYLEKADTFRKSNQ